MSDVFLVIFLTVTMFGVGLGSGLLLGRRIWGPRWFDTSEGIDREFLRMKDF